MVCAVVSGHEVSLRYDICLISIASYMTSAFGNAGTVCILIVTTEGPHDVTLDLARNSNEGGG